MSHHRTTSDETAAQAVAAARNFFPRGLAQPEGSFRFSIDALLLAAFAAQQLRNGLPGLPSGPASSGMAGAGCASPAFFEAGCGCGAASFGLLLAAPPGLTLQGHGIDQNPELVEAAALNAQRLGFSRQISFYAANLEDVAGQPGGPESGLPPSARRTINRENSGLPFAPASCALALANPPYRLPGSGRMPQNAARRNALFAGPQTLLAFTRAMALALKPGGKACFIFSRPRLPELVEHCRACGLQTLERLPVQSRAEEAPRLELVLARKLEAPQASAPYGQLGREAGPVPRILPPLTLYEKNGAESRLTESALAFCPWLACNAAPALK